MASSSGGTVGHCMKLGGDKVVKNTEKWRSYFRQHTVKLCHRMLWVLHLHKG